MTFNDKNVGDIIGYDLVRHRHGRARHGARAGHAANPGTALTPERNAKGTRVHSAERIQRLLDQGRRPGVVPLGAEVLGDLDAVPAASSRQETIGPAHAALIALASSGDIIALTAVFSDGRNGGW